MVYRVVVVHWVCCVLQHCFVGDVVEVVLETAQGRLATTGLGVASVALKRNKAKGAGRHNYAFVLIVVVGSRERII